MGQSPGTLVILEQFELVLAKSDAAAGLVADHLDRGLCLIAVVRPEFRLKQLQSVAQLRRRLEPVLVGPPDEIELAAILRRRLETHPLCGQIELSADVLPMIQSISARRPGSNPGSALGVLDAVISRAVFAGQRCVGPDDVFHLVPGKRDP